MKAKIRKLKFVVSKKELSIWKKKIKELPMADELVIGRSIVRFAIISHKEKVFERKRLTAIYHYILFSGLTAEISKPYRGFKQAKYAFFRSEVKGLLASYKLFNDLSAALTAGYHPNSSKKGTPLKIESLEQTLRIMRFSNRRTKLFNDLTRKKRK